MPPARPALGSRLREIASIAWLLLAAGTVACGAAAEDVDGRTADPTRPPEPTAPGEAFTPRPRVGDAVLGAPIGCSGSVKRDVGAVHASERRRPSFVYAANQNSHDVSTYAVEPNGALVQRGASVSVGHYPRSLALHPDGKSLFVANGGSGSLSVLSADPSSGALRTEGDDVDDCGPAPVSVLVHPSGEWVFVGAGDASLASGDAITTYAFDAETRRLRRHGQQPTGSAGLLAVIAEPSGRFLYTANSLGDSVGAFRFDECSGALSSIGEFATAAFPVSLAVSPAGTLHVASGGPEPVVQTFAIDSATGGLRAVGAERIGFAPWSLRALHSAGGKFLLLVSLAEGGSAMLSSLHLDAATGLPVPTPVWTVTAGSNATGVAVEPTGRLAYVGNFGSNDISCFALDPAGGGVTPLGAVPAGVAPGALAIASAEGSGTP